MFIGGFVAERCKIERHTLPGYSVLGPDKPDEVGADVDMLIHYVNHDVKHNIHRIITASFNKELEVRK